jgi:hypothetical protein
MLFATGLALLALGPRRGFVLGLHKASFVVWFAATGIHVLAHLRRVARFGLADWRPSQASVVRGSFVRRTLVAGSLAAGVVLALATLQYADPWVRWVTRG